MANPHLPKYNALLEAVSNEHEFRRLYDELMHGNCRIFNKRTGKRATNFHSTIDGKASYTYINAQQSTGRAEWDNLSNFLEIRETLN